MRFIHIPKCAGTSVKRAGGVEIVRPKHLRPEYFENLKIAMQSRGMSHHAEHARWRDLQAIYQYGCFTVVRNPYARAWSRYKFLCKILHERGERPPSLEEWFYLRDDLVGRPFWWHRTTENWYPQYMHVSDKKGLLRVRIFKLEEPEELEDFLKTKLPRKNASKSSASWEEAFSEEQKKVIQELHDIDFRKFGYER